ncbi:unnamed protein product [Cuscuta campestris]|uniref:Endonuclease/exonuclease/phosphatase domain-containing protein n=1 Tax=Cuscuta campestris TaxID=132261 RepID=A0A484MW34_9ASTE|nr:unnamed protein product [Cuscuta campestris]
MSILSWNCRGLGNRRTVQELADLVSAKKPDFILLLETKGARGHAEELKVKIGFEGLFVVDSVGLSGGLALLWKENRTANLISYSRYHIDIVVSLQNVVPWRFTGFYGNPKRDQRGSSWDLLRSLKHHSSLPWAVMSDFNDLCSVREEKGGCPHPISLISGFNQALEDCGLFDLGMIGYPFTWERGRGSHNWVEERLDRVVVSGAWRDLFTQACVFNNFMRTSDHAALHLCLDRAIRVHRARRFRFENAWMRDTGFKDVLTEACRDSTGEPFSDRLAACGKRLMCWGGDKFQHFGKRRKELEKLIGGIRGKRDDQSLLALNYAEKELACLRDQEDLYWRQRAKQHWLNSGDANTRFFHQYASH